ncbi:RAM signaling pathway protein-domain-containing protein [Rhodofomes roseus]|uniref:RAM signaling pathway protein-domain-containing protein n=1 Tax=Rhodofomes roseus TaxID=34475 RepID=A0ABQ8KUR7_9APHY|nr:RAM signaling pathway protein-domain-containing protein [Rhodofomes roseus]KAH9842729.1 RAM signaling pathway protein-domain-containing protein [Rhodofomes roseus]
MLSPDLDGRTPSHAYRNGASSPLHSVVLSHEYIFEALVKSSDDSATLDFTHKGLTDVGEAGAEEIAAVGQEAGDSSTVVRIALAYNRLTTLPMAFALIARLRYLVLKNNNFSVFPHVLTVMPSLEILDISRNKIKRLPSDPGSLVNLRVFSILRNKIQKLPPSFTQFQELTLFKVDGNPLEWPPKAVMDSSENLDDPQAMKEWIKRLQRWIEDNSSSRKMSEDSVLLDSDAVSEYSLQATSAASSSREELHTSASYHARSYSVESELSTYFQLDRSQSSSEPSKPRLNWPPRLQVSNGFPTRSAVPSPSRSVRSHSRSPDSLYPLDELIPSADEESPSGGLERLAANGLTQTEAISASRTSSMTSTLTVRKGSLDARPAKLQLTTSLDHIDLPPPRPLFFHSGSNSASSSPNRGPDEPASASPITTAPERPAPAMDQKRNAYFRRLSALTPLNLSKTIPEDLLALVDAVRGILFGVSQIYQTLQHYTVYAIDERLSAVLMKVLDPASVYMTQLITALDRFDTMSRRTVPPPSVCRAVVESCRDNVTVFGKAVGVLALQLKVLATHDDVRYTRQMLLTLYGAMAEIATSWQAMASRIEAVRPLLWEGRPPPVGKGYAAQTQASRVANGHGTDSSRSPISAPAHGSSFASPLDYSRRRQNMAPPTPDESKTRMSRRHAGSFSSKDVEKGRWIPSNDIVPSLTAGVLTGAAPPMPVPRPQRRNAMTPLSASGHSFSGLTANGSHHANGSSTAGVNQTYFTVHSRQGSGSSMLPSASVLALKMAQMEAPSNTSTLVDNEAIEAMKQALDAAPTIWRTIAEIMAGTDDDQEELKDTLAKAKEIVERLTKNIDALQDGSASVDKLSKPLHDDARAFAKMVIQLSSAIKTHIEAHPLSAELRNKIGKVTSATEEFVILLHVSSFSPAPTPRPYSPMVPMGAAPSPLGVPDDKLSLSAGITRSRSALQSNKLRPPNMRDPPHSAQPHQTFAIPTPPRFGTPRRDGIDHSTPVQS